MADISLSQLINESLIVEESQNADDKKQGWFSKLSGKVSSTFNSAKERGTKAFNSAKERGTKAFNSTKERGTKTYNAAKEYVTDHPNIVKGAKIGGGVALAGGAAYGLKKGYDAYKNSHSFVGRAKKFGSSTGGKVAAGTLAALGAGVGVKALLKYLRKKKIS